MRHVLLAVSTLVLAACGMAQPCAKCMRPPAVEVMVKDADTNALLADADVSGTNRSTGQSCRHREGGCGEGCFSLDGDASGTYAVTVKAAGYTDASFTFDLEEDGCGMWDGARREVKLRKAADAQVTALESALGCGH